MRLRRLRDKLKIDIDTYGFFNLALILFRDSETDKPLKDWLKCVVSDPDKLKKLLRLTDRYFPVRDRRK